MPKRLFIALELPANCRETLANLGTPIRGVRWLTTNQLHLTLSFLGDVDEEAEIRLREELAEVRVPPFILRVGELGTFNTTHPSTLWAGVGSGHPHLFALHKRVHDALFAARFDPELRSFRPHITIARLTNVQPPTLGPILKKHEADEFCVIEITAFALFSSKPSAEGSCYTVEQRYQLSQSHAGGRNSD
ncbi:MAG TPA: RNA 2',3'-cyclic phosphodiesterase [Luteolibacter sp.]